MKFINKLFFVYLSLFIVIFISIIFSPFALNNVENLIKRCQTGDFLKKYQCYTTLIIDTFKSKNMDLALNTAAEIAKKDPEFATTCHTSMHDLGKAAYETYKRTRKIKVGDKLSYCNYGFYHSFIESMIVADGNIEGAKNFCDQIGNKNNDSITISNCYHGIGHGISSEPSKVGSIYEMSLPGLLICKQIPIDNGYQRSCQLGVFNSMVLLYDDPKYMLKKPKNAFSLCFENNYDEGERSACLLQMATLETGIYQTDFETMFNHALSVDHKYTAEVFKDISTYGIQTGEPQDILNTCKKIKPQYTPECIYGIAAGLKAYAKLGDIYQRDIDFYYNSNMSSTEKDIFLNSILTIDVNTKAEQQKVCSQFPQELRVGPCNNI